MARDDLGQEAPRRGAQAHSGRRRKALRFLLAPELGRLLAPSWEAIGAFGDVLAEAGGAADRLRREKGRRLAWRGWGALVVVLGALAMGAYALLVLLEGVLRLAVPEVQAQEFVLGEADSKTLELLDFLFGLGRGEDSGVGDMLLYYNAAMMLVVAVLLVYQVVFAVVETGRTGEGRLTGWQVMRCVLVVGLLFPLPATGLGPGQHVVIELADLSGRLASGVWKRFAGVLVAGGTGVPLHIPSQHREMVTRLIVVETCMYVHNQVAAAAGDGPYITVQREGNDEEVRYWYRDPSPLGRHRPCGRVLVSTHSGVKNPGAQRMAAAHANAIRSPGFVAGLERAAREVGDRFLPDRPQAGEALPEVDAWLDGTGLSEMYAAALRSEGAAATREARAALQSEVEEAIDREGWLGASSFFLVISRNQSTFNDALSAIPEVTVGGASGRLDLYRAVIAPWDRAEEVVARWLASSEGVVVSARLTQGDSGGFFEGLLEWFPSDWATWVDPENPLEALVSAGNWFTYGGLALLGARMAGGFGFGGVVGAAFSALSRSVLETAGTLAMAAGFAALAVGIALAYLLPLIPFLRFYFGVIAWVLSLIEAVLAMPLFLAMQVAGEERGLVTRGARSGYLLLLQAVVRPALMIFGLVLGYFVFVAAIGLLNWQYEAHLEGVNESGRLGGLTFLVALAVYAVVAYIVANVSFKAIDVIPQEVLGWLGGRVRSSADDTTTVAGSLRGSMSRLSTLRMLGRGGR